MNSKSEKILSKAWTIKKKSHISITNLNLEFGQFFQNQARKRIGVDWSKIITAIRQHFLRIPLIWVSKADWNWVFPNLLKKFFWTTNNVPVERLFALFFVSKKVVFPRFFAFLVQKARLQLGFAFLFYQHSFPPPTSVFSVRVFLCLP